MIRHTVMFTLKNPRSAEEVELLEAASELREISTVRKFEILRQVSPKCDHHFGLSMEFENQDAYQFYNDHPDHVAFVENQWIPKVASWQEIDYVLYDPES